MSVLLEMAMFPTSGDESKSKFVAEIIKVIKSSGFNYQLTPMGTIIETQQISQALEVVQKCYEKLEEFGCNRVYSSIKLDIRKGSDNRITSKVKSVEDII